MSQIVVDVRGSIELWTMSAPERRNALSRALVAQMQREIERVVHQPETRVVVLTGAGTQAFSAGADLKERATMSADEVRDFGLTVRRLMRSMERSDRGSSRHDRLDDGRSHDAPRCRPDNRPAIYLRNPGRSQQYDSFHGRSPFA
jgi:hypothetical protein